MSAIYLSRKNPTKGKWESKKYKDFDELSKELDVLLKFGVQDFMISAKRWDKEAFGKLGVYFKKRRQSFKVDPNGNLLKNMSSDGTAGGFAGFFGSAVGSVAYQGGAAGVYNFLSIVIQSGLVTACKTASVTPDPTTVAIGAGVGLVIGVAHGIYRTCATARISVSEVDPESIDIEFYREAA